MIAPPVEARIIGFLERLREHDARARPHLSGLREKPLPGQAPDVRVPLAELEETMPVAVLLLEGAVLCPHRLAGRGEPVLVRTPACADDGRCACAPRPLSPGDVLGPPFDVP